MIVFLAIVLLWILGSIGTLLLFKYTELKHDVDEHLIACMFWPVYLLVLGIRIVADYIDDLNDKISEWING